MDLFAKQFTTLFAISIFANFVIAIPQIFTDTYAFCEYEFGEKKVTFPDKLWTISTKDFTLHYSLCSSVQRICHNQTSTCLIQKNNNQVIDLGHEFTTDADEEFTLVSQGAKCSSNYRKNYILKISLQCSDSIKSKPRLMSSEDDCTFEVIMMKPDCEPKCTEIVAGAYLLDLRSLKKTFQVEVDSKKFSVTLCGSNRECPNEIGACEILQNGATPLASVESQHFNYDVTKDELTARGRYKQGRVVRDVQVLLKCNWDTDLANATYKKVPVQGKHYRFEVESSFGCIKLPQSCVVSSFGNLHYDLSKLYRSQGWTVSGFPRGKLFLNICGSLDQPEGVCSDQYSQVCQLYNKAYTNWGSILSSLEADSDIIKARFSSGSRCIEDPQFLYSTEIQFMCSKTEKDPTFKKIQGCVMLLTWETPRACPVDFYKGDNCYMNDRVGNRNLQQLHTQSDKIHPLTPNKKTKLIYNLCGPIHESCNNFTNVSFCLKTDKKESVIGFENKELISENGQLRLELKGSTCSNKKSQAGVVVDFVCTYETPPPPSLISVLEDGCKFNVTVFTQKACLSRGIFNNCAYSTANLTYDLSGLTTKNKNYVVGDQNVEFIFNVCGPIVSGPGALCRGNTMVCWKNKTEVNVRYKYQSLGGVERTKWHHTSDGLIMEAEMGAFCEGLGHYKSVFQFECSKTKLAPLFLSKHNCIYTFKWKTPEACPREKKCLVPGSKPDSALDLTKLQKKTVQVHIDGTNQYEFDLCNDMYTTYSNGITNRFFLSREYFTFEKNSYVVLDLQNDCDSTSSTASKVIFEMECSETLNDVFDNKTYFEDCVLNMTIHTHIVCPPTKEKQVSYSIIEHESTIENPYPTQNTQNFENNCTVFNEQTGYEFKLNKMKSEEILFNYTRFFINFDGNLSRCSGAFCKNDSKVVEDECPTPFFDYISQQVKLPYSTSAQCFSGGNYEFEVVLKCNQTRSGGKIVKDEICKSTVTYGLPEACYLLKQDIASAGHVRTAVIAGSVTSVVLLIGCAILIYFNRRRCGQYLHYVPLFNNKSAVPVYIRDSNL